MDVAAVNDSPLALSTVAPGLCFESAFQLQPTPLAFLSKDLRFQRVNLALCRLLDYEEGELLRVALPDLLHSNHVEELERVVSGQAPAARTERYCRTGSGGSLWCALTLTGVAGTDGGMICGLLTIDATRGELMNAPALSAQERRAFGKSTPQKAAALAAPGASGLVKAWEAGDTSIAEQALRTSEDRYRDLVENSGLLIGMHTLDGTILSVNQSLVRAAGYRCALDLIGKSIGDLLAVDVRHLFADYLVTIRETGHAHGIMKIMTPAGDERILAYDNSVRDDGLASPVVRCFGHDVTERVRAARALRASEARYRALYEDNPAMYFTVDADGIILSVNQFGAAQLGFATEDLVGYSVLSVFHEEDRPEVMRQMAACLQRPAEVAYWEFRKVRRDGSVLWVREAARALPAADGRIQVLIVCEDITERRQAEQALRDGEARLRAIGDNLPNGAVYQLVREADRTQFSYVSAGIQQLLGVTIDEIMRDTRALFDRIVPEDRLRMQVALDESMQALSALDVEVRIRAPRSQVQWIQFRAAPRRTENGTLWDGVMVDVTRSRSDLEALLQTVGAIIWEAEGDVRADTVPETFVSQQAARLTGYSIREMMDQPTFWLDHMDAEDRTAVLAQRRASIDAGRDYEVHYRMRGRDGRTVWLREIVNVVARDAQRVKLRGISVDVTESKRKEAALRESEERFRTLADTMPAALLIYHGDTWVYANPAAEAVTGYSRTELMGMKIWELAHPEWRALVRDRLEKRRRGEELPPRSELCLQTRNGREHWIEVITTPITFQGQASILVTGFDITERRLAEAALRDSREALRKSHERARELSGRLMIMQEDERRRISRELHDDVNQKVAALAITVSRIRQEYPDSADLVRAQLSSLQSRMASLSDDVRMLSHQLHPAALEHTGLVTSLRSYCAEFSSQEGIPISLAIRERSDAIPLDVALTLYRIVQESLRNVARHAGPCDVRVALDVDEGSIVLSIADTGVGFDPDQERLKGGLGLVSMEERIRLLHGSFVINARPQGGTEIRVQLPCGRT